MTPAKIPMNVFSKYWYSFTNWRFVYFFLPVVSVVSVYTLYNKQNKALVEINSRAKETLVLRSFSLPEVFKNIENEAVPAKIVQHKKTIKTLHSQSLKVQTSSNLSKSESGRTQRATNLATRSAWRVLWDSVLLLHLGVCLGLLLAGVCILWSAQTLESNYQRCIVLLIVTIFFCIPIRQKFKGDSFGLPSSPAGSTNFIAQIAAVESPSYSPNRPNKFIKLCQLLENIPLGIAFFLTGIAGAIISKSSKSILILFLNTEDEAREIAMRFQQLNLLLYMGTLLLTTSVLERGALHQWALTYLPKENKELSAALEALATSYITRRGIYYTLLLAASYLPCVAVLRHRVNKLAPKKLTFAEKEKWLQEHGLASSGIETTQRIIAIFGPLLAGPLGELLKILPH